MAAEPALAASFISRLLADGRRLFLRGGRMGPKSPPPWPRSTGPCRGVVAELRLPVPGTDVGWLVRVGPSQLFL